MQVQCPHCRKPVTVSPEQAGQKMACPNCGGPFLTPSASPAPTPVMPNVAATPVVPTFAPTMPESAPSVVIDETRRRPIFRPRLYPMLTGVMVFFYVLAGLAVLSLVLWLVLIWSAVGAVSSQASEFGMNTGASTFSAAIMSLSLLIGHAMWAAICVLVAESVKLGLDIQANTQESAFHLRHKD